MRLLPCFALELFLSSHWVGAPTFFHNSKNELEIKDSSAMLAPAIRGMKGVKQEQP
jgi:hypothetical protein